MREVLILLRMVFHELWQEVDVRHLSCNELVKQGGSLFSDPKSVSRSFRPDSPELCCFPLGALHSLLSRAH